MPMGAGCPFRTSPFTLLGAFLLGWFFSHAAAFAEEGNRADRLLMATERPLTSDQTQILRRAASLLVMIPGVSSGDLDESGRFLDRVRIQGRQEAALFLDWDANKLARTVVAPAAVDPAARRLIAICETFRDGPADKTGVDILAHSAGTVVLNKAARAIVDTGSSVRFRHVLLLGTALDADEPLDSLKQVSAGVLNLHSAHDKVNRNVNDRLGRLSALEGGAYRNIPMDRSLGGRLIRHGVFLASNPENELQYGLYLGSGQWPEPAPWRAEDRLQPAALHALALWVRAHPDVAHGEILARLPEWLRHPEPQVRYYAVVLAGLLQAKSLGPALKTLLADARTPVYLRKEIYQALGNFKDGAEVEFLRAARQTDRACGEELRDVLRALKRARVEAP